MKINISLTSRWREIENFGSETYPELAKRGGISTKLAAYSRDPSLHSGYDFGEKRSFSTKALTLALDRDVKNLYEPVHEKRDLIV